MKKKETKKKQIHLATALLSFINQTKIEETSLIEVINDTFKKAYSHHINVLMKDQQKEIPPLKSEVKFNKPKTKISFFIYKKVVRTIENPLIEIKLKEAIAIDPDAKKDDEVLTEVYVEDFPSTLIFHFRQILKQKLHELNVEKTYKQFLPLKETVVSCVVDSVHDNYAFVNVNGYTCFLPKSAQLPNEELKIGKKMVVFITNVLPNSRGSQVTVSRKISKLLLALLKLEVIEYQQGIIDVVKFVRMPGERTILVVDSKDPNVDPLGAFLGQGSNRIKSVSSLLNDEKISIAKYDKDIKKLIVNLLNPARVKGIKIMDNDEYATELSQKTDESKQTEETVKKTKLAFPQKAIVVVKNEDLFLALGKKGSLVRAASKLTQCYIEIMLESNAIEQHLKYDPIEASSYDRKSERNQESIAASKKDDEDLLDWRDIFHEYETEE